jgi:hypothetical protein
MGNFAFLNQNIVPIDSGVVTNNTYTLGTSSAIWSTLYVGSINAQNLTLSGSASIVGNLTVDTDTLFVDSVNNKIGIGTTSPGNGFVHILESAVASATYRSSAPLAIERNGDCEFQIISNVANSGQIRFGDGGSNFRGALTYDHSADAMVLVTAATERMRIDSAGLVGIGTVNPSQTLDVSGSIHGLGDLRITNSTPYFTLKGTRNFENSEKGEVSGIDFFTDDGSRNLARIVCDNQSNSSLPEGELVFFTAPGAGVATVATERLRISAHGDIGIGTADPSQTLDVNGIIHGGIESVFYDGTRGLKLTSSGGNTSGVLDTYANHNMEFRTNNVTRMFLDTSGNIGIGTGANPSQTLDVSGNIYATAHCFLNSITSRGITLTATAYNSRALYVQTGYVDYNSFVTHGTQNITNDQTFMYKVNRTSLLNTTTAISELNHLYLTADVSNTGTITDFNYIKMDPLSLTTVSSITNANIIKFGSAATSHQMIDTGTVKATPSLVATWLKFSENGTTLYVPGYTSKTA